MLPCAWSCLSNRLSLLKTDPSRLCRSRMTAADSDARKTLSLVGSHPVVDEPGCAAGDGADGRALAAAGERTDSRTGTR
jgi:hypothetical protein